MPAACSIFKRDFGIRNRPWAPIHNAKAIRSKASKPLLVEWRPFADRWTRSRAMDKDANKGRGSEANRQMARTARDKMAVKQAARRPVSQTASAAGRQVSRPQAGTLVLRVALKAVPRAAESLVALTVATLLVAM